MDFPSRQSTIGDVIEQMDQYFLSREDWDSIVELGVGDRREAHILLADIDHQSEVVGEQLEYQNVVTLLLGQLNSVELVGAITVSGSNSFKIVVVS